MQNSNGPRPSGSSSPVNIVRANADGLTALEDRVATEEPLEISVDYERRGGLRVARSVSVTMRTPGSDRELAAGFLFGEGILDEAGQVSEIAPLPGQANTIRVSLRPGVEVNLKSLERHFYTTSSFGVCGKASIEALRMERGVHQDADAPLVDLRTALDLPGALRQAQRVFDVTGGLHGAALFDPLGNLICVREDVGRHNAVDKVIGAQFLASRMPLSHDILVLSGRASFELVQKAVVAGIPILVAVGAPSSLAVEVARQFGTTLLGFVRDGRINVYSGAQRLREARVSLTPT